MKGNTWENTQQASPKTGFGKNWAQIWDKLHSLQIFDISEFEFGQ